MPDDGKNLVNDHIVAEARNDTTGWQPFASFPRDIFPGETDEVRLGKIHGVERTDDHGDHGPGGSVTLRPLRTYGK